MLWVPVQNSCAIQFNSAIQQLSAERAEAKALEEDATAVGGGKKKRSKTERRARRRR